MKANDILKLYTLKLSEYGKDAFKHVSEIMKESEALYFEQIDPNKDKLQSWRTVKGATLEKFMELIIRQGFENTPLRIVSGKHLQTKTDKKLSAELKFLRDKLLIDYSVGKYLPDLDLVVYTAEPLHVIAILSIKASLRERIAQVAYWAKKVDVPYYFLTTDGDKDFAKTLANKPRAIAEDDTDGVYLITDNIVQETDKVKSFDKLIDDLKKLIP